MVWFFLDEGIQMLVKTIFHSFQLANNLGLNSFTMMAFSPASEYFIWGLFSAPFLIFQHLRQNICVTVPYLCTSKSCMQLHHYIHSSTKSLSGFGQQRSTLDGSRCYRGQRQRREQCCPCRYFQSHYVLERKC